MKLDLSDEALQDLVGERIAYIKDWLPQYLNDVYISETKQFLDGANIKKIKQKLMPIIEEDLGTELISAVDRYLFELAAIQDEE